MDNLYLDKEFPISQPEDSYYHEYVRLYLANIALTAQVKQLVEDRNGLASRLSKYEDEDCGGSSYEKLLERNKRFRRTAHQIQRYYKCTVRGCEKSYGSQGSLNQHYKLKHPEIYVTLPNVQPLKEGFDQNEPVSEEENKPKRKQPKRKEHGDRQKAI